jgi:hypothetical protein
MPVRWLTVFLDFPADSFDAGVSFWREVTGCGLSPFRGAAGELATLLPASGDAYLRVQRLFEGDGRCHLDLHVDTAAESLEESAAMAEALGARVQHREEGELIIADSPGGFTFCLVRWEGETTVPGPLCTDGGASRVDTLCLDVPPERFEPECAFWAALTGWELRPARVPGFSYLRRPTGMPVRILLQRLDSAAPGQRAGAHVDFGCSDKQAVGRHSDLGARIVGTLPYWTVLADPAGREYCLVKRVPDDGRSGA